MPFNPRILLTAITTSLLTTACSTSDLPETRLNWRTQNIHVGQVRVALGKAEVNGHRKLPTLVAPGLKITWTHH